MFPINIKSDQWSSERQSRSQADFETEELKREIIGQDSDKKSERIHMQDQNVKD